jgi:hypothetical protein
MERPALTIMSRWPADRALNRSANRNLRYSPRNRDQTHDDKSAGMKLLQNPSITLRPWLIAMMLVAANAPAQAQARDSDNEAKILRCRQNVSELMWLDREKLRARCGLWSRTYTTKTSKGEIEKLVYSRYFVVTLRDGVVSSVRQKRQIFTGLKKTANP